MTDERAEPSFRTRVAVNELAPGEIMPPLAPEHDSWAVMDGWVDPLAPQCGYRTPSGKTAVLCDGAPAIAWAPGKDCERCLVAGEETWRDYSAECRLQVLQAEAGPCLDGHFITSASAGLVCRVETSRRFYYFCIQGQRRIVLFRRIDDEWFELDAQDVPCEAGRTVTLRVTAEGDALRAECPELGVAMFATDTRLAAGKVGFRARGSCLLFGLEVTMTPSQERVNRRLAAGRTARTGRLGASVPDEEKVAEISLPPGAELLEATDFCRTGRNDLLCRTPDGLLATTWDGVELWRSPERPVFHVVFSEPVDGGRRIYGNVGDRKSEPGADVRGQAYDWTVADEMIAINGSTGAVLSRVRLPATPDAHMIRFLDFSYETGRLVSDSAVDVVVRVWRKDCGGGGRELWACDGDLNLIWEQRVDPPYGHHNAVHLIDLDGDGRSEVMAGGTLLSAQGEVLAVHDRAEEQLALYGAHHYDAVVVGDLAEDPDIGPTAFLMGGCSGVYAIDALTGRTRACHRIGHAQWGLPAKLRDDVPGTQVLAGTRWGNYGILTLFSGRGERLWTIQPDYILQGSWPVQWTPDGPQHIWLNTTCEAQGLYDGFGRLVKPLNRVRELWQGRRPGQCLSRVLRRGPNGPGLLAVQIDDALHVFGAAGG